jgi:hypothetical protein
LERPAQPGGGGSLAPRKEVGFRLTLSADAQPGTLDLDAEQRYPDGGIVQWPVTMTITPPAKSPSQNLALAGVVALIGLLTIAAIVMLAPAALTGAPRRLSRRLTSSRRAPASLAGH